MGGRAKDIILGDLSTGNESICFQVYFSTLGKKSASASRCRVREWGDAINFTITGHQLRKAPTPIGASLHPTCRASKPMGSTGRPPTNSPRSAQKANLIWVLTCLQRPHAYYSAANQSRESDVTIQGGQGRARMLSLTRCKKLNTIFKKSPERGTSSTCNFGTPTATGRATSVKTRLRLSVEL